MKRLAMSALVAFVFAIPWEDSVTIPGLGTIGRIVGMLAFFVGMASIVTRYGVSVRRPAAFLLPSALFAVWTVTSILWAPDRGSAITYAGTIVQLVIMSWLVWQLCSGHRERFVLIQAYVLGCLVSVANTMVQFASGNTVLGSSMARFAATGFNPNYLAATLALGIPMAWYLVTSRQSRWLQVVNALAIPAIVMTIFLTGSRGGLLVSTLALSSIPLTYTQLKFKARVALITAIVGIGFVGSLFAPNLDAELAGGAQRFAQIPEQLATGDMTGRGDIWLAGVKLVRDHPILGVGAGGFAASIKPYLGKTKTAHNAFLNVTAQSGFIGLLFFLSILLVIVAPFALNPRGERTIFLVLLATAALSLVPSTLENGKQIWFVLSLAASHTAFVLHQRVAPSKAVRAAATQYVVTATRASPTK